MEVTREEFGGKMVTLYEGDDLHAVPKSHKKLISPEIESWWRDPISAARTIAKDAITPRMGAWFLAMAEGGVWWLELHKASHGGAAAGFHYFAAGIRGAEVAPPKSGLSLDDLPPDLAAYYRLVGTVDWMGFGAAGGLYGAEGRTHLTFSPTSITERRSI
jgi:hypothetical protein